MPEGQPVDTPKKRRLLGFYVAAFALLGLVIAGLLLYEPLKLSYAIYRVRRDGGAIKMSSRFWGTPPADKWMLICASAACSGNAQAMEVVVDKHSIPVWSPPPAALVKHWTPPSQTMEHQTVGYLAARAQPELFFAVLACRPDEHAKEALFDIERGVSDVVVHRSRTVRDAIGGLQVTIYLLTNRDFDGVAADPKRLRLAQEALGFARRRFARKLAEPEKKKAVEEPK